MAMSILRFQEPLKRLITRPYTCLSLSLKQHDQDHKRISTNTKQSKRYMSTQQPGLDQTFYELRTYSIKPEHMSAFVALTKEKIFPRLEHSKLIGYWVTDLGGLNEVVHIWEYDNFAQRTAVRAALAADKHWQESYFQHITKMMTKQDNVILKALPQIPLHTEPYKEGGIYELRRYKMKPALPTSYLQPLMPLLTSRINQLQKLDAGKCMGAWRTEIGNINAVYHLWNYESMDQRIEARHTVLQSDEVQEANKSNILPAKSMTNKIMLPMPFSPLN